MSKITRRETLARGGQAVAAAAVLPVAAKAALASEGEDSKLLALGRLFQNRWAYMEGLVKEQDQAFLDGVKAEEDRIAALVGKGWDEFAGIERQIAAIPAKTFAGIAIKLRVPAKELTNEGPYDPYELNLKNALADAEWRAGGMS